MYKLLKNFYRTSVKKDGFFITELNKGVVGAQYPIRGYLPQLAFRIKWDIESGNTSYPFDQVTFCNISNPQFFNQKPITFFREVVSCVVNPTLLENQTINLDARIRAKKYLDQIVSSGMKSVRENVAKFIARKDSCQAPDPQQIYLTEGASQGVHLLFNLLLTDPNDSILCSVPIYPLYSAALSLYGGTLTKFNLDEENGWDLNMKDLQRAMQEAKQNGKKVKAIVIVNPSNPTGAVLTGARIRNVIQFAVKHKIVIIADQVYRDNIYLQSAYFVSFRQVLQTMGQEYREQCQIATINSVSKGVIGQSGMRGGYLYLHNFNPQFMDQITKLKSIHLCANSLGQIMVDLMVNPPIEGVSDLTTSKYIQQISDVFDSLKYRAKLASKILNEMVNVECAEVVGSMNAFPKIKFSGKAKEAAAEKGMEVDLFYCAELLKATGIVIIPGSGFLQAPGTYHFRITTLILPEKKFHDKLRILKDFNDKFHAQYAD